MSKTVVLTGVGRDRVGIVAELAEVLYDLGCNLLDSSMTLLRGEFAIILMVSLSEGCSINKLQEKLAAVENRLGLAIHARELTDRELVDEEAPGIMHMISVYGADKPGIVVGITRVLQKLGVNITDVETQYSGSDPRKHSPASVFMMVLEVSLPLSLTTENLEHALRDACKKLGVDVSVQMLDVAEL